MQVTETKTTKCGDGTTLVTEPRTGTMTIRITESHQHKTPSCYAGKTFILKHVSHDTATSKDGSRVSEWDAYESTFQNGKIVKFTKYALGWFVRKENAWRGNWIKVEVL